MSANSELLNALSYSATKRISYTGSFIYERKKEILDHLLDDNIKFISIISNMNSGKTYSLLKICIEENLPVILTTPLILIAEQKYNEIIKEFPDTKVALIKGSSKFGTKDGTSEDKIQKMLVEDNFKVFIVVFDSLQKVAQNALTIDEKFILVIDESHNLINQYHFRHESINKVIYWEKNFQKVVYLTATPEASLPDFYYKDLKNLVFVNNQKRIEENKIEVTQYNNIDKHFLLTNIIVSAEATKLIVLMYDDYKELQKLKNVLVNIGYEENSVIVLSSNEKNTEEFQAIVENSEFNSHIKVVLTTRLFSDGVNIYNRIGTLILVDVKDYWMKRQFIGRFRKGINRIIDLHKKFDENERFFPKRRLYLSNTLSFAEELTTTYNKPIYSNQIRNNQLKKKRLYSNPLKADHFFFSSINKKYEISWASILSEYQNLLNSAIHTSFKTLRTFYESICGYSIEEKVVNTANFTITKEMISKALLNPKYCSLDKFIEIVEIMFDEFMFVYSVNNRKYFESYKIIMNLNGSVDDNLMFQNSEVVNCFISNNEVETIITEALELYLGGISKEFIIELIKTSGKSVNTFKKSIELIKIHSFLRFIEKNPKDNNLKNNRHAPKEYLYASFLFDKIKNAKISIACLQSEFKRVQNSSDNGFYKRVLRIHYINRNIFKGRRHSGSINISGLRDIRQVLFNYGIIENHTFDDSLLSYALYLSGNFEIR